MGGSGKAPRKLHRGSAQGLGSVRSGCKAGEEDGVEDKGRSARARCSQVRCNV